MSQCGRPWDRDHRGGEPARGRTLVVRLGRQQGRPVGQRRAPVLGAGPEHTTVALLYLESFGNPRKFARIARRFARRKPLLAVKSGRSAAGARATSSHTGALLSASDVTVDALFEQAGVIRTDTLHELFDVARCWPRSRCRAATGSRSSPTAAGPGSCAPTPARPTVSTSPSCRPRSRRGSPAVACRSASPGNPIDMIATATAEDYRRTLQAADRRGRVRRDPDDLRAAAGDPGRPTSPRAIREVGRGDRGAGVAIAAVFMTDAGTPAELGSERVRVPGYEFPEDAARAVALAAKHGRWRARPGPAAGRTRRPPTRTRPPRSSPGSSPRAPAGSTPTRWSSCCSTATGCRWSTRGCRADGAGGSRGRDRARRPRSR